MAKMISAVNLALALTILLPGVSQAQTSQAQTLPASVIPHFHVLIVGSEASDFTARVNRYFELRSRLQRGLPAVIVTDDVAAIRRGTRSLAQAIRLARPGAVEGEFFTIATSLYMKRELAVVVNATVWVVIMDDNPGAFRHDIDGAYPEGKPRSTMPGIVLAQLPPLPDGIEFRFIGPHLILYDTRANTIIDRLPDAIQCEDRCAH
jgi:hypothetical protein